MMLYVSKNLEMYILFDLIISLLGIHPKAETGQAQVYIFIIRSVAIVKV